MRIGWYALALLIIVLDQLSKAWVQAEFAVGDRLMILPVFDLTLVYNKGAAWSFLSNAGGWQRWLLTAISLIASVVLVIWIYRAEQQRLLLLALSCILGGAVGNLIDRAMMGQVVDFLLFYYGDWSFPVFNLADSAITLGAGLLILDMIVSGATDDAGQQQ